jgi:RNA-directed DNA polymerase
MKIENIHIEKIKTDFANMQNKKDLVAIINYAKEVLWKQNKKKVTIKGLSFYANPLLCKKRYSTFEVAKKSGGKRIINAPSKGFKLILRPLNLLLQCIAEPHHAAFGFVPEKSIVDNAKMHIGKNYIYNIDLKDFFHSFDRNRVKIGLMQAPFNLTGDKEPLAFLLSCLCTHPFEINGATQVVLPQGSPTSPTLTNILCRKLDIRLQGLANRFNTTYSRYADDITFSSNHNVFNDPIFLNELDRIIVADQKLEINPSKVRLQKKTIRQEVTGLTISETKVNVNRKYIKDLRQYFHLIDNFGIAKAESIFTSWYKKEKGHVKQGNPNMQNVLAGKLDYLKMVKGGNDSTYILLKERYKHHYKIGDDMFAEQLDINDIDKIMDKWESEGIEIAIKLFVKSKAN